MTELLKKSIVEDIDDAKKVDKESFHSNLKFFQLMGGLAILVLLLSVSLITPIGQGFLVYLNIPAWFWLDFAQPESPQSYFFPGSPRTTNHRISSTNNVELGLWHTLPQNDTILNFRPKAKQQVVMYVHGNGATRAFGWALHKYQLFSSSPFDSHVISFDYRGFADSTGWPTEQGLHDDALAVWDYITSNSSGLGFSPDKVIIYGHSLGTGVSSRLARHLCERNKCPAGLILEAPFLSIMEVVRGFVPFQSIYYFIDNFLQHRFSSSEHISHVTCPVRIIHGENDPIISSTHGESLFRQRHHLDPNSVSFISVKNAGHDDVLKFENAVGFLKKFWDTIY